jgi:hypothetical protein
MAAIASAIVKVFEAVDEDFIAGEKRTLLLPIIERIVSDYGGQGLRIFWKTDTIQYVRNLRNPSGLPIRLPT